MWGVRVICVGCECGVCGLCVCGGGVGCVCVCDLSVCTAIGVEMRVFFVWLFVVPLNCLYIRF